jgi:hypothetical protein
MDYIRPQRQFAEWTQYRRFCPSCGSDVDLKNGPRNIRLLYLRTVLSLILVLALIFNFARRPAGTCTRFAGLTRPLSRSFRLFFPQAITFWTEKCCAHIPSGV